MNEQTWSFEVKSSANSKNQFAGEENEILSNIPKNTKPAKNTRGSWFPAR